MTLTENELARRAALDDEPTEVDRYLAAVTQAEGEKADDYRARWEPRERFRIYFVWDGQTPAERIEVAGTETWEGIGTMLRTLTKEGELVGGRSAVLDTLPWAAGYPGHWIVGSLA